MNSFHTRYRPSKFEDVLGQDVAVRSLKKVIKDARGKSFLFTGPSGTGKTTLARIVAAEFSGVNSSVVNIEEVDGASKSGADAIRELVQRTLYKAIGSSPTKFIIVDEAHRLSSAAWAVLLKPIEEPPSHVYYALCTTEVSKIPKTIITRCLRYDLKPVKEELILELLVKVADAEKLEVSDEILEAIAENCGGSPRQGLVFLEECLACRSLGEARQVMRSAGESKEVIDLARWLCSGKVFTWVEAAKYLKAISEHDPESVRIQLVNYFAVVLLNAKSDKAAAGLLNLIEVFSTPYSASDKMAPLMYSLGLALKLDA